MKKTGTDVIDATYNKWLILVFSGTDTEQFFAAADLELQPVCSLVYNYKYSSSTVILIN